MQLDCACAACMEVTARLCSCISPLLSASLLYAFLRRLSFPAAAENGTLSSRPQHEMAPSRVPTSRQAVGKPPTPSALVT